MIIFMNDLFRRNRRDYFYLVDDLDNESDQKIHTPKRGSRQETKGENGFN